MESLKTFGTLFPIIETFSPYTISEFPRVKRGLIQHPTSGYATPESDILVSCCLFPAARRNSFLTVLGNRYVHEEFFAENVIPGRKYWEGITTMRQRFGNKPWLRIYLEESLQELCGWLVEECGFDEVCLMPSRENMAAMLWRYLPILDAKFERVICVGIDALDPGLHSFLTAPNCWTLGAALYPNRWWMPFCGPITIRPSALAQALHELAAAGAILGAPAIPECMSGFLSIYQSADRVLWPSGTLGKAMHHATKMPATIDAVFLTALFWRDCFLSAGDCAWTAQARYRFNQVRPQSIMDALNFTTQKQPPAAFSEALADK